MAADRATGFSNHANNNNNNNSKNGRNGSYFTWLATSNDKDSFGLLFTASPWELILNNLEFFGEEKLPGWMKISSYCSTTAGIRISRIK